MDATFALTIIGTLFALYSILPEQKRVRIRYVFGFPEKLCICFLIIFMFLSLLLGIFYSVNYGKDLVYPIVVFLGTNLQFICEFTYIFTGVAIFLLITYPLVSKKVEIKNFDSFLGIIDNCFNEKKYPVLIALLDENYDNIFHNPQNESVDNDDLSPEDLFSEILENFHNDIKKGRNNEF